MEFKINDEVIIKPGAIQSWKNNGAPLLEDVVFIIVYIDEDRNCVDLIIEDCKRYDIHFLLGEEIRLMDKGSFHLEGVPIYAIEKVG